MKPLHALRRVELSSTEHTGLSDSTTDGMRSSTLHRTSWSSLDVWEHQPGVFEWLSEHDHSTCIIGGVAEVTLDDGRTIAVRRGNALYLPKGKRSRWQVARTLRAVSVQTKR